MNTLQKVGGLLLAGILLIALIAGLSTGTGREAGGSVLDGGRAVLSASGGWIAEIGGNVNLAGDLAAALIVGLISFTAAVLLIPKARAGNGFLIAAFASLLLALLLFQPSIGTALRDAVNGS